MFKNFLNKKASIIEETDPDNIYVENVRSFFNIPTKWARYICKVAVRQGILRRRFGVRCKNQSCERIITVFDNEDSIPEHIECLHCQIDGDVDYSFETKDLEIVELYQFIENNDTKEH